MTHPIGLPRAAVALVGAIALMGAVAACGAEAPKRDSPSGQITESSDADVFSLQVGDCFNAETLEEGESEELGSLPVVPCAEPHNSEIFAEFTLDDGDFPGDDAIMEQADEYCGAQFTEFFGVPLEKQDMESADLYWHWPLTPTKNGWEYGDDRLVQCVISPYDDAAMVTGSMKGLGAAAPAE